MFAEKVQDQNTIHQITGKRWIHCYDTRHCLVDDAVQKIEEVK